MLLLITNIFLTFFSFNSLPLPEVKEERICMADTSKIDSLQLLTVGEIFITGNAKTKDYIILRELELKKGDTIRYWKLYSTLVKDKNRIYNTRLFNSVNVYPRISPYHMVDIYIDVQERWYFFPMLILDLADPNFNIWWRQQNHSLNRLEYGIRFSLKNFRGRNEELRTTFQIGFTKRFELLYNLPYIDKSRKHGLRFYGSYATNNNIFYKTTDHILQPFELENQDRLRERLRYGIKWNYRQRFYTNHGLETNYFYAQVDDTVAKINPNYFGNGNTTQRYFSLKYDFRYDYRDIVSYPLKGSRVAFSVEKLGLSRFDDINQWEFMGEYIKYTDLGSGFYIANQFKGRFSFGTSQPYYNLRSLGIRQDYVRGFDLNVIEGQHYLLNKNTIRKRVVSGLINFDWLTRIKQFNKVPFAVYLKSYFDVGYVNNHFYYPENQKLINTPLPGGGVGIDIVTFYDVVLRIEGSMNKQGQKFLFFNVRADIN